VSLRTKLTLSVLLTAIPLGLVLVWVRTVSQRRAVESELREYVEGSMRAGGRMLCEAWPRQFSVGGINPGPPPGNGPNPMFELPEGVELPEGFGFPGGPDMAKLAAASKPKPGQLVALWAYDPAFDSANPSAAEVPAALRAQLQDGAGHASEYFDWDGIESMRLVMRMDWDSGPCAIVMVERQVEDRLAEGAAVLFWGLAALFAAVLGAVLLVAGPMVRRIRALGAQVKRASEDHYETEVAVSGSDEIASLARDFNEAGGRVRRHVEAVEARRQSLRDFVAHTTHDVMIPLTVLQGHLSEIREQHEQGAAPTAESLRGSLREAHYIGSLLHNLGAAAKLESGNIEAAEDDVDLDRLIRRVAERHKPLARAGGIELEHASPDDPVHTRGDVTLIEQAVNNLVHNAVRYGSAGGHVSLLLATDEEHFTITVWDDGPGVSTEELARLSEPGFRASGARTREPSGAGLGLSIAHEVAKRHGFEIVFRRIDEGGLEATLRGRTRYGGTESGEDFATS
jgi:two-component system sensor histidine kinase BaeS